MNKVKDKSTTILHNNIRNRLVALILLVAGFVISNNTHKWHDKFAYI